MLLLVLLAPLAPLQAAEPPAAPAFAFYYGAQPPWSELKAFDTVVVDPDHVPQPAPYSTAQTQLAAYVSVGEVQPSRAYAGKIPNAWLLGDNPAWGSRLIDQSAADWPEFFVSQVIAPLWDSGYRAFFLDTLDSYRLFASTPQAQQRQQQGLVAVVTLLKQRFPQARLIFNRGFELLAQTHELVSAVVAESLFQRYDARLAQYSAVPPADRQWLLQQLQQVRSQWQLPVVVIDYVAPSERPLARSTAQQIAALGFIPWVSTGDLASVGIGAIEAMPRRILVVHGDQQDERAVTLLAPVRILSMPLSYLGYVPEFVDVNHLPEGTLPGRYAGAAVWLSTVPSADGMQRLQNWLRKQQRDHLPVALIAPAPELLRTLAGPKFGLTLDNYSATRAPVRIVQQAPMMGYEQVVRPVVDDFFPLHLHAGTALLTLQQGSRQQIAAAITPWGGYAVGKYAVANLPGLIDSRWTIDPFAFFQAALQLPDMPVPDVSTETGRRMLMVHMDGDGFISRAELPNAPIAGEVVRDRIVKRYALPMTISVIEAEVSPTGLYPSMSALAEQVARDIFQAPNVAIGSHSYSHPFYWYKVGSDTVSGGYNLRIPGYQFDLQREVAGSIDYIQQRLAPPGTAVQVFLWTGDCVPIGDAVGMTVRKQVLNLNGGATVATRSSPTLTQIDGLGIQRQGGFQVYAPNQNDNIYTHNWQGPFYGYERVIETFELTETPRRLKPMDIYFHTFIASKRAGLKSLEKVFSYALAQESTPVHIADYARKVLDFQDLSIARSASGWRIRDAGALRTLRLPQSLGWPDLAASQHLAGYRAVSDYSYLHLDAGNAELQLRAVPDNSPTLVSANAAIAHHASTAGQQHWQLQGYVGLQVTLSHVENCSIRFADQDILPVRHEGALSYYEIPQHVAGTLDAICRT